jgi:DNA gyrase/topoisomerase IV subunit B
MFSSTKGSPSILTAISYFPKTVCTIFYTRNIDSPITYPIIHLQEEDLEFAFTHSASQYSEEYFSFVNGQHTTQGGTHQNSFREALTKTIREFYKRDFDANDIKTSLIIALSIRVNEPVFESQTKTKLGSQYMDGHEKGVTIRNYIGDILKRRLDNYLHMNPDTAEALLRKILQSEKERKDMATIKKLAKERVKKQVFITRSCAIAVSIIMKTTNADSKVPFSLPRAILLRAVLPKHAM